MALKDIWQNLVDGASEIDSNDINNIAEAVIALENGSGGGGGGGDAFSPTATVEQTENGAKITITDKNGTTTAIVTNGYTPQREVDYWTDNDKAEIKSYVDEAILGGAW
jgi:hypothetical protein